MKKILLIIFKYHKNNKKILFVGISGKNLKNKSNHLFLASRCWVNGLLSNKTTAFKYIKIRLTSLVANNLESFFSLRTKPDLIVLLANDNKTIITKEASSLKIPIVILPNKISKLLKLLIITMLKLN